MSRRSLTADRRSSRDSGSQTELTLIMQRLFHLVERQQPKALPFESTSPNPTSVATPTTPGSRPDSWRNKIRVVEPTETLKQVAAQLHLHTGGANYKLIAEQSVMAMEKLLVMISETTHLVRSSGFIPVALLSEHVEKFKTLLAESKKAVHRRSRSSNSQPSSPHHTPSHAQQIGSQNPPALKPSFVDLDDQLELPESSTNPIIKPVGVLPLAPEDGVDVYDLAVFHPSLNTTSPASSFFEEDEDIVGFLRTRVKQLYAENQDMQVSLTRLENQLKRMRESAQAMADQANRTQTELEREVSKLYELYGKGGNSKVEPPPLAVRRMQSTPQLSPTTLQQPSDARVQTADSARSGRSQSQGSVVSRQNLHSAQSVSTQRGNVDSAREGGTISPFVLTFTDEDRNSGNPSPSSTTLRSARSTNASNTADRMEHYYVDAFKGRGFEFVWKALCVVWMREFDVLAPTPSAATTASSPPQRQHSGNSSSNSPGKKSRLEVEQSLAEPIRRFQEQFKQTISSQVENTTELQSRFFQSFTPFPSVKRILEPFTADRDVEELNLANMLIGDVGIQPLLPVLSRMYRLKKLNLCNNGLKANAIHGLTQTLLRHATICELDLSGNPLPRTAGKDVLSLVNAVRTLTSVNLDDTLLESAVLAKIADRLAMNAKVGANPTLEAASSNGSFAADQ